MVMFDDKSGVVVSREREVVIAITIVIRANSHTLNAFEKETFLVGLTCELHSISLRMVSLSPVRMFPSN